MVHTIEIDGDLKKKQDSTVQLTIAIDPKVTYTEYVENEVVIAAAGEASINMGGITNPKFIYVETDNPIEFKCFRAAVNVATSLPVESSMLLTPNTGYRFGTVTLKNSGASDANVKVYMAE